jgi:putative endopeptidase
MKVFVSSAIALAALAAAPIQAAIPANVAKLIDTTVNPCDDFYQYACGSWIKANALGPNDRSKDTSFSVVTDRNEAVIQDIVNQDWPLIGDFWDSCRDTTTLDALGNKVLATQFNKISKAATKTDLMRVAGELAKTSARFGIDFDVAGDYKNAKQNIMYVGNADLSLPDLSYYGDEAWWAKHEAGYRKYITTVMKASGFNPNAGSQQGNQQGGAVSIDAKYFEDTVLKVELALFDLLTKVQDQTGEDAYYNPIAIGDAMKRWPLTIGAYFTGAGILEKSKLTTDSKVIFYYFDYPDLLEKLIASLSATELKTYLAFQLVNNRVRYLSEPFYDAYFQFFSKEINGQTVRSTRDSICVFRVKQFFPDLIGKYYFMKMFDKEREDSARLMSKLINNAMADHIAKLDWLDNPTRLEAAAKLGKVANLVGQSTVKQNYPFALARDALYNNIQSILENDYSNKVKKLGNAVDRDLWSISPAEVNAYYSPLENKMVFPAAILQEPFFSGKAHPAQNFGSIGAVIGHELTHGFDSKGRTYDGDGTRRNWWTASTAAEFEKRATCMKKQYSSFNVTSGETGKPFITMNGVTTITENIADNGGFSLSWDAYHEFAKTAALDKTVTEKEANQTLFLAFAQTWCSLDRDAAIANLIRTDPHSPGEWRAKGVAMNSAHFGETFGCAVGTPMNPETKCQLW